MRYGFLVLVVLLALCALCPADDPTVATTPGNEPTLKALVERLEARVTELESELARMKSAQQGAIIGGSLLDHAEDLNDLSPGVLRRLPFPLANGSTRIGALQVDRHGVIRNTSGQPIGYWGVDLAPIDLTLGPSSKR